MTRKTLNAALLISAMALTTGLAFAQTNFQDVLQTGPDAPFYGIIQIATGLGLAVPSSMGPCLNASSGTNPPILPPPSYGPAPSPATCPYFGPDANITRAEAAYWIVKSQLDEAQITAYLCATGGDPSGLSPQCNTGITGSTFGDLGVAGASIANPFIGVSNAQFMRYIEVMARRGYTKGCGSTNDAVQQFCPNDPVNRAQIAVFIIRAKMNSVFPTTLSGVIGSSPASDNFSYPLTPYFTDVTPTDPVWGPYFPYVQVMRELGITYGTSPTTYSPGGDVTREQIAAFAVRAFFL